MFSNGKTPQVRYHGLRNQGATCYLNSVLQVLFMTKDYREAVKSSENPDTEFIDHHLTALFDDLQKGTSDTYKITRKLGIDRVYEQRDAAEYYEKILNLTSHDASQVFHGKLTHKTICSSCDDQSDSDAAFWHLPLTLVDSHSERYSVENGIEEYFKDADFSGENQMYCDLCDDKSDATIKCLVKSHPEVLMLLLKRFEFNFTYMTYVKNNCTVEVPYTLKTPQNQKYKLYAVVDHYGDLRSGHYTATIKSQDDGTWYTFDDTKVTLNDYQPFQVDQSETSNSAYLLFYRKINVHADDTCNPNISEMSSPEDLPSATSDINGQVEEESEEAEQASNDTAESVPINGNVEQDEMNEEQMIVEDVKTEKVNEESEEKEKSRTNDPDRHAENQDNAALSDIRLNINENPGSSQEVEQHHDLRSVSVNKQGDQKSMEEVDEKGEIRADEMEGSEQQTLYTIYDLYLGRVGDDKQNTSKDNEKCKDGNISSYEREGQQKRDKGEDKEVEEQVRGDDIDKQRKDQSESQYDYDQDGDQSNRLGDTAQNKPEGKLSSTYTGHEVATVVRQNKRQQNDEVGSGKRRRKEESPVHADDTCNPNISEMPYSEDLPSATSDNNDQVEEESEEAEQVSNDITASFSINGNVETETETEGLKPDTHSNVESQDSMTSNSQENNEEKNEPSYNPQDAHTEITMIDTEMRGKVETDDEVNERENLSKENPLEERVEDQKNDNEREKTPDTKLAVSDEHVIQGHPNKQDEMNEEQIRVEDVNTEKVETTRDDEESEKKEKSRTDYPNRDAENQDNAAINDNGLNTKDNLGGSQEVKQHDDLHSVCMNKQGDQKVTEEADEIREIRGDDIDTLRKDPSENQCDYDQDGDQSNRSLGDAAQNKPEGKLSSTHIGHEGASVVRQTKEQQNEKDEDAQSEADSPKRQEGSDGSRGCAEIQEVDSVEGRREDSPVHADDTCNPNISETSSPEDLPSATSDVSGQVEEESEEAEQVSNDITASFSINGNVETETETEGLTPDTHSNVESQDSMTSNSQETNEENTDSSYNHQDAHTEITMIDTEMRGKVETDDEAENRENVVTKDSVQTGGKEPQPDTDSDEESHNNKTSGQENNEEKNDSSYDPQDDHPETILNDKDMRGKVETDAEEKERENLSKENPLEERIEDQGNDSEIEKTLDTHFDFKAALSDEHATEGHPNEQDEMNEEQRRVEDVNTEKVEMTRDDEESEEKEKSGTDYPNRDAENQDKAALSDNGLNINENLGGSQEVEQLHDLQSKDGNISSYEREGQQRGDKGDDKKVEEQIRGDDIDTQRKDLSESQHEYDQDGIQSNRSLGDTAQNKPEGKLSSTYTGHEGASVVRQTKEQQNEKDKDAQSEADSPQRQEGSDGSRGCAEIQEVGSDEIRGEDSPVHADDTGNPNISEMPYSEDLPSATSDNNDQVEEESEEAEQVSSDITASFSINGNVETETETEGLTPDTHSNVESQDNKTSSSQENNEEKNEPSYNPQDVHTEITMIDTDVRGKAETDDEAENRENVGTKDSVQTGGKEPQPDTDSDEESHNNKTSGQENNEEKNDSSYDPQDDHPETILNDKDMRGKVETDDEVNERENLSKENPLEERVEDQKNDNEREKTPDTKLAVSDEHVIQGHPNKQDEMNEEQIRVEDVNTEKVETTRDDEESEKKEKSRTDYPNRVAENQDNAAISDNGLNTKDNLGGSQEVKQHDDLHSVSMNRQEDQKVTEKAGEIREIRGDDIDTLRKDPSESQQDYDQDGDQSNRSLGDAAQNKSEGKLSSTHTGHEGASVLSQTREQQNEKDKDAQSEADSPQRQEGSDGSRGCAEIQEVGSDEGRRREDSQPKGKKKFSKERVGEKSGSKKSKSFRGIFGSKKRKSDKKNDPDVGSVTESFGNLSLSDSGSPEQQKSLSEKSVRKENREPDTQQEDSKRKVKTPGCSPFSLKGKKSKQNSEHDSD